MNKDQVKGRVKEATGKAKQSVGKVLGNERMQVDGKVQECSAKPRRSSAT